MIRNFFKKGITLLEVMITIAIVAIMVAVVAPQFSKMRNAQILKSSGEDVLSVLNKARSQTLASLNSTEYGVHFESNRVVLFSGTVYDPNSVSNEITDIFPPATISIVSFGGSAEFYFNRLSGNASKAGSVTISISSEPGLTKTITVSTIGGVSMN